MIRQKIRTQNKGDIDIIQPCNHPILHLGCHELQLRDVARVFAGAIIYNLGSFGSRMRREGLSASLKTGFDDVWEYDGECSLTHKPDDYVFTHMDDFKVGVADYTFLTEEFVPFAKDILGEHYHSIPPAVLDARNEVIKVIEDTSLWLLMEDAQRVNKGMLKGMLKMLAGKVNAWHNRDLLARISVHSREIDTWPKELMDYVVKYYLDKPITTRPEVTGYRCSRKQCKLNTAELKFEDGTHLQLVPYIHNGNIEGFDSALLYQGGTLEALATERPSRYARDDEKGFWTKGKITQQQLAEYLNAAVLINRQVFDDHLAGRFDDAAWKNQYQEFYCMVNPSGMTLEKLKEGTVRVFEERPGSV